MSLQTVIQTGLVRSSRPARALVLMGGGARTAYQVGALQALASMLRLRPGGTERFPFQLLVGTSAGALNAAYLAGAATQGLGAFDQLAHFWGGLHCDDVYSLRVPAWVRISRLLAAVRLWGDARRQGAVLDTLPLVATLHRAISLGGIDASLVAGAIDAVAVTASSYSTGVHWTFCHARPGGGRAPWQRPGRRAEFQPLSIEHLMASSAIPFLFPATPLWVDGHCEYFGDGSMRQVSPLSPALHLGATQVLVVGVGQPERSGLGQRTATTDGALPHAARVDSGGGRSSSLAPPGLGAIAGHALASVFHDTLQADVEQAQRVTATLRQLPREVAGVLPYRPVEVLALQPSQSLDALAQAHLGSLPTAVQRALGGLGAMRGAGGGGLASYLLFEPAFVQALVALGAQDAYARKSELLSFFA